MLKRSFYLAALVAIVLPLSGCLEEVLSEEPSPTPSPLDLKPAAMWAEAYYRTHPYEGLAYQAVTTKGSSVLIGFQMPALLAVQVKTASPLDRMNFTEKPCPTANAPIWGMLGDRGRVEVWLLHGDNLIHNVTCSRP